MTSLIIFTVLTVLSAILVGYAKGVCDTLQFHYSSSKYAKRNPLWWDASVSWKNKYKDWDAGDKRPKFPLSTTWLVTFTDAWHAFQFVQNMAISAVPVFFALAIWQYPLSKNLLFWVVSFALVRIALQIGFLFGYERNQKDVKSAIETLNTAGGF